MAGNSKIAQPMKMMERMDTIMEESEKKIEMMVTALRSLISEPQNDDGEKPHDEEWEGNGKGEPDTKKKKEEGGK